MVVVKKGIYYQIGLIILIIDSQIARVIHFFLILITDTGEIVNTTESPPYRPYKEMTCLKEPPPMTTNVNIPGIPAQNIPTNIYPYYTNPYPSITPPLYYHSIDYNGACYPAYSEVPAYPENITPPAYHVPQIVPVAYPEDVYQQISQVICQPMVPASH